MSTVLTYDAIGANVSALPRGQAAGYSTGSSWVPWTAADWKAHPGAVQIDQAPRNTAANEHADVLDVETGAATVADAPGWAKAARKNFTAATRPGQRKPAIYVNLSNVTAVVNELTRGGVTSGVGLWIANWNLNQPEAESLVNVGSGPFPVIGCQFRDAGLYDVSVFSAAWLHDVSGKPAPVVTTPPPAGWAYKAPGDLKGIVSRQVALAWAPAAAAGEPAPASYTVQLWKGTVLQRTVVVKGVTAVLAGLSDGPHEVRVWANGGKSAPPGATHTFIV